MMKKIVTTLLLMISVGLAETDLTEQEMEAQILEMQAALKEKREEKKVSQTTKVIKKASKGFLYMGYGIGAGSGVYAVENRQASGASTNTEIEMDVVSGTLKIGYAQENNNRWELSITGISTERIDGVEEKFSGVDLNWYAVYDLSENNHKPFWSIGFGSYTWEDTAALVVGDEDIKGGALNLAGGVFLDVGKKVELELAYRVKVIGWQELVNGTTIESHAHAYAQFFVGFNYRFNDK